MQKRGWEKLSTTVEFFCFLDVATQHFQFVLACVWPLCASEILYLPLGQQSLSGGGKMLFFKAFLKQQQTPAIYGVPRVTMVETVKNWKGGNSLKPPPRCLLR